ncbi:MAG TPA: hypothetical protein VIK89_14115 [Cytophagaceae bacterium]
MGKRKNITYFLTVGCIILALLSSSFSADFVVENKISGKEKKDESSRKNREELKPTVSLEAVVPVLNIDFQQWIPESPQYRFVAEASSKIAIAEVLPPIRYFENLFLFFIVTQAP